MSRENDEPKREFAKTRNIANPKNIMINGEHISVLFLRVADWVVVGENGDTFLIYLLNGSRHPNADWLAMHLAHHWIRAFLEGRNANIMCKDDRNRD